MSFTTLTLTGTIETQPGSPVGGATVSILLSHQVSDGVTDIAPTPQFTKSASNGTFSLTGVVANDDSTTIPTGTYYAVTISTGAGQVLDQFSVIVPHADAPTVDLFSLARLSGAPAASTPYVISINGESGVVTLASGGVESFNTRTGTVTLEAADVDPLLTAPWNTYDFPGSLVVDTVTDPGPAIASTTLTKAVIAATTQGSSNSVIEIIKSGSSNQSLTYDFNGAVVQEFSLSPEISLVGGTDYVTLEITTAGTGAAGFVISLM